MNDLKRLDLNQIIRVFRDGFILHGYKERIFREN